MQTSIKRRSSRQYVTEPQAQLQMSERTDDVDRLKERVYNELTVPEGRKNGLEIRKLDMIAAKTSHRNTEDKVQKVSMDKPSIHILTKYVLMVGVTGAGKTTLINAMVNFIFGIQFEDKFRLILIDDKEAPQKRIAESQTDWISAYEFNYIPGMPFKYNYVLIDTPGFGDTRGISRDQEMLCQLETFLKEDYGVDQVDAVGFVTPASVARLTQTQKYVFDGLSSMFGVDVKDNIYIMATFADNKDAPVLGALTDAQIVYKGFYKFSNSGLFAANKTIVKKVWSDDSDEEDEDEFLHLSKTYWDMGQRNLRKFFQKLGKLTPVSLRLTVDVLERRRKLQTIIAGLQNQLNVGLQMLANLHQERKMLTNAKADVEDNRNYEEEISIPKIIKVTLPKAECVTNCTKCSFSCHSPCYLNKAANKKKCWIMSDDVCRACPGKCPWHLHEHMDFKFDTTSVKEMRSVKEVYARYQIAFEGVKNKSTVIKKIGQDIDDHVKHLLHVVQEAQSHVEMLEKIALKPNPISAVDYINLLIQSETMQKRTDFQMRVNMLEQLKMQMITLSKVKGAVDVADKGGESFLLHFKNLKIAA